MPESLIHATLGAQLIATFDNPGLTDRIVADTEATVPDILWP